MFSLNENYINIPYCDYPININRSETTYEPI